MRLVAAAHPAMSFDTLYLGGGTPSVLGASSLEEIIGAARRLFAVGPEAEITVEVNPGTVDAGSLRRLRRAGVNRLNIGVQSFHDRTLAFLGRIHGAGEARSAVDWSRAAGFDNIGIDLIYGVPGQTPGVWGSDLDTALQLDLAHLACYGLTLEPGTALAAALRRKEFAAADDAMIAALYRQTVETLADAGFEHYEISNFARSRERRSRHNCKYWSFTPYLGLGPSAHSFIAPRRCWNHADVAVYIAELQKGRRPVANGETLSRGQLMTEALYLGLRLTAGIDMTAFGDRFGVGFMDTFGEAAARFEQQGLVKTGAGRCRLTPCGRLFLDAVAAAFIDAVA
jgi:oxygen-independent coproporphyrinogen-3 oxidase